MHCGITARKETGCMRNGNCVSTRTTTANQDKQITWIWDWHEANSSHHSHRHYVTSFVLRSSSWNDHRNAALTIRLVCFCVSVLHWLIRPSYDSLFRRLACFIRLKLNADCAQQRAGKFNLACRLWNTFWSGWPTPKLNYHWHSLGWTSVCCRLNYPIT